MITLTTPIVLPRVLGGATTVNYDKLVAEQVTYFATPGNIQATVHVLASADPAAQPLSGTLTIANGEANFRIADLDIPPIKLALSGPQQTGVRNRVNAQQDTLEDDLIAVGFVDGTQSTGQ